MPLKVIVVGAGLGGLGSAIAMSRSGHEVEVFEQSSFLNEVGAAIHLPPNASRVLKAWGCDFAELDPVFCHGIKLYTQSGEFTTTAVETRVLHEKLHIKDEWLLTHRVDLHNALRKMATCQSSNTKLKIHLRSRVQSVDSKDGAIYLDDGTMHKADLIIGADGVHSRTIVETTEVEPTQLSTKQNCFRFLVPMAKINANPITKALFEKLGLDYQHVYLSQDRRLVIYPCRAGELLNVVAVHPTNKDIDAGTSAWLSGGKLEDLVETYRDFCPEIVEMCKLAEDLKLWSLATRDPPRTFSKGKLVLVGDAAHAMLPHQGQGGAQSFEDAAALGVLFSHDTKPEQIAERLKLYEKIRYERAVTVMFMSRINNEKRAGMMGELRKFVPKAKLPCDMFEYTWSSYPIAEAACELERLKTAQNDDKILIQHQHQHTERVKSQLCI